MSLVLTVARYRYTDELTQGLLYIGGKHYGYTLENPWKDNEENESCIPTGIYDTSIREAKQSPSRNYDHLILDDVPNRTYILWHVGNYEKDTEGCIMPGKTATTSMVGRSRDAFNEVMQSCRESDGEIKTRVVDVEI